MRSREQLSEHFTLREFVCPCCGLMIFNDRLLVALEDLRRRCGDRPVTILSGVRCPDYNEAADGGPCSQHLVGTACDIVVRDLHPYEVAEHAEAVTQFAHGGIGVYPNRGFVHVDVRNGVARWDG